MATVLVTGGTGFVGRELVNQLLRRGDDVVVFSRSRPRLDVRWIEGDLTRLADVDQCCGVTNLEVIYHLASLPGDTGDPRQMIQVNVVGLENLLKAATVVRPRRFVLSSSISAYEWYPATKFQPPLSLPVDETHPCRPKDMYSLTKLMQELLTLTYHHQYQLPVSILRVTAVVGPDGSGGGRMWRDFAEQLREGRRVQLPFLAESELSHFVDVRDVAAMHIDVANHPGADGQVFNCCAAKATRGHEFASYVKEVAPVATVDYGYPWSMAQGGEIEFDMSKLKQTTGFVPQYTVRDAVRSIYEWTLSGGLAAAR